jgi:hypothetical protein
VLRDGADDDADQLVGMAAGPYLGEGGGGVANEDLERRIGVEILQQFTELHGGLLAGGMPVRGRARL